MNHRHGTCRMGRLRREPSTPRARAAPSRSHGSAGSQPRQTQESLSGRTTEERVLHRGRSSKPCDIKEPVQRHPHQHEPYNDSCKQPTARQLLAQIAQKHPQSDVRNQTRTMTFTAPNVCGASDVSTDERCRQENNEHARRVDHRELPTSR